MPIMPETEVKLVSVDMLREAIAEGRRWRAIADELAEAVVVALEEIDATDSWMTNDCTCLRCMTVGYCTTVLAEYNKLKEVEDE